MQALPLKYSVEDEKLAEKTIRMAMNGNPAGAIRFMITELESRG